MSAPLLNNSIVKHDFLNIKIPVQDNIHMHRQAIMQQMRKMKSNTRYRTVLLV